MFNIISDLLPVAETDIIKQRVFCCPILQITMLFLTHGGIYPHNLKMGNSIGGG